MALLRWWWVVVCAVACAVAQAPLRPVAAAYDSSGNLFYVDAGRNQVFEVALSGALTVVAGNGAQGFSGDGGAATAAMLNEPQGVAVGGDGAVYVSDAGNGRVRKIVGGVISTVASGLRRPTALAVDATGALLVCETDGQRVVKVVGGVVSAFAGSGVQGFGGDGGVATGSMLNEPAGIGVLVDGRVVIADAGNQRLRVVDTSGVISTLVGSGAVATLDGPRGLGVSGGAVYVADAGNQRVRMVDASGVVTTLVGTGVQGGSVDGVVVGAAMLNVPRAVAVGPYGVAVVDASGVRVVDAGGVYFVAPMPAARVSHVVVQAASGQASVTVSGDAGVPRGTVIVQDGGVTVGMGTLTAGAATVSLSGLSVGTHTLTALYSGDGVNPAASGSTGLVVGQAATSVVLEPVSATYVGLPIVMTAVVSSTTSGVVTGTASFTDNGVVVGGGSVSGGVATVTELSPAQGAHVLTAAYSGDGNFAGSSSAAQSVTVSAMPDFALSVGTTSATVAGGLPASYAIHVASVGGAFTGVVNFSVAGLQPGATTVFSPSAVVPGVNGEDATLTVQTVALASWMHGGVVWAMMLPVVVFVRKRGGRLVLVSAVCVGLAGCGARTVGSAVVQQRTYPMTVTATATNLAGQIVSHTTQATLVVE